MFALAKRSADRILKIRPQSVFELKGKLLRKKLAPEVVDAVIADLLEQKLLDDEFFAKCWIRWRLQRSLGINRIAYELKEKGVDREIIAKELRSLRQTHDEFEVARELAQRQSERHKNIEPVKKRKRISDFLARRGFMFETIKKVLLVLNDK